MSKGSIDRLLIMLLLICITIPQTAITLLTDINSHTIGIYQSISRVSLVQFLF